MRKLLSKLRERICLHSFREEIFEKQYLEKKCLRVDFNDSTVQCCSIKLEEPKIAKKFVACTSSEMIRILQMVTNLKIEMDREMGRSMLKFAPIDSIFFDKSVNTIVVVVFGMPTLTTARQTLITYKERLTLKERMQTFEYVADCMHFFHSRSWTHGALSWDNVFWDKDTNRFTMGDFNRSRTDVSKHVFTNSKIFTTCSDIADFGVMILESLTYSVCIIVTLLIR